MNVVEISVEDTGKGIDNEKKNTLFKFFGNLGNPNTNNGNDFKNIN